MSDPYIGEIRMFGGNFPPRGWAFCNGQLLSIAENDVLYGLIGTTYGGDGQETFALPDLRGRLPIHQGPSYELGSASGTETVTLTSAQMPAHTHGVVVTSAEAEVTNPSGNLFGTSSGTPLYGAVNPGKGVTLNPGVVSQTGGSEPHDNLMPSLCLSFIIALEGIYPQQG